MRFRCTHPSFLGIRFGFRNRAFKALLQELFSGQTEFSNLTLPIITSVTKNVNLFYFFRCYVQITFPF